MRTLEFTVDCQKVRKKSDCDFSGLIAGSIGFLRAKFHFSEEWKECRKAASFWVKGQEYAVLLDEDDSCMISPEALSSERFEVSVTGVRQGFKIVTNKTKVRQEVS